MSEDKHFRRALVPGLVISALLIGVGFGKASPWASSAWWAAGRC